MHGIAVCVIISEKWEKCMVIAARTNTAAKETGVSSGGNIEHGRDKLEPYRGVQ